MWRSGPNPIVDLKDKDPIQVNRDMAICQREASSKIIALGNAVTHCMQKKGYTILVEY